MGHVHVQCWLQTHAEQCKFGSDAGQWSGKQSWDPSWTKQIGHIYDFETQTPRDGLRDIFDELADEVANDANNAFDLMGWLLKKLQIYYYWDCHPGQSIF